MLGDTHAGRLAETQQELGDRFGADRVRTAVCDVTVEGQITAFLDLAEEGGPIDVMINNAGLGGSVSILDMTDEQWARSSMSRSPAPSAASAPSAGAWSPPVPRGSS